MPETTGAPRQPGPSDVRGSLALWPDFTGGICAQTDPELFFPDVGQPSAPAIEVCQRCPVVSECLEYALAHRIEHGVWGGMSAVQRRDLQGERARNADKIAEANRLRANGVEVRTIAARFGLNERTIYRWPRDQDDAQPGAVTHGAAVTHIERLNVDHPVDADSARSEAT